MFLKKSLLNRSKIWIVDFAIFGIFWAFRMLGRWQKSGSLGIKMKSEILDGSGISARNGIFRDLVRPCKLLDNIKEFFKILTFRVFNIFGNSAKCGMFGIFWAFRMSGRWQKSGRLGISMKSEISDRSGISLRSGRFQIFCKSREICKFLDTIILRNSSKF